MAEFLRREDTLNQYRDSIAFYHAHPPLTHGICELKDGRFYVYSYEDCQAVGDKLEEQNRIYVPSLEAAKAVVLLLE